MRIFSEKEINLFKKRHSKLVLKSPPDFILIMYVIRCLCEVTSMRAEKYDSEEWNEEVQPEGHIHHQMNSNYQQMIVFVNNITDKKIKHTSEAGVMFTKLVDLFKKIYLLEEEYKPQQWDMSKYTPDIRTISSRSDTFDFIFNNFVI